MNPISNVGAVGTLPAVTSGRTEAAPPTTSFKDVLLKSIEEVNSM